MNTLETYIERITQSETIDDAFEKYCAIIKKLGYDRVVYSLLTDHPSINLPRQHGLASSYPEQWVKDYNEKGYMDYDPVAKLLLETVTPFFWSDTLKALDTTGIPAKVMNEARESGLNDGIAFSMPSKFGEVTAFGLARTNSDDKETKDYRCLASIHLLGLFFHETCQQKHQQKHEITLTVRETEILQWASEGKTDDIISDILNISANTVRFHWKNIFQKLDAHGRVYAITKAIRLQLITPVLIRPTYQKQ